MVLKTVLGGTDVIVQNLARGAAIRMGLPYEAFRDEHPGLMVCGISSYGQDGLYENKKAYDLLIQSEAGVLSVTGTPSQPAKVGILIVDISAGMYAYGNIPAPVLQRQKTGHG